MDWIVIANGLDGYFDIVKEKINYEAPDWLPCGDLKVVFLFAGQQKKFKKFPWFLFKSYIRARDQKLNVGGLVQKYLT